MGRTVGNAVEVEESLEVLAGGGPDDVVELTLALAAEMLDAAGLDGVDPAQTLRDGSAMDRFRELVAAQGGDLSQTLPVGAHAETITAPRGGTMGNIDAMAVGLAVWRLGAGRSVPVSECSSVPGCASTAVPASRSPRAKRCSRSTPRRRNASSPRSPNWPVAGRRRHGADAAPIDHRSDHRRGREEQGVK